MMTLSILTPDKEVYSGAITSVIVPGVSGQFEILKDHAPLISALGEGNVTVTTDSNQKNTYQIKKGYIEVLNNTVSLLVQGLTPA